MARVLLKFNEKKISKPITAQVILEQGIPLNILKADVKPTGGEILVEIPEDSVEKVINSFRSKGVIVTFEERIEVDKEKCIHCGACFSLCPANVIAFESDYSVVFNESNCFACGLCVDACPTQALKLL